MVIHTKKKAKIHMHEPKKAKIKGSNIYTVQRGPKIASAKINDTGKKKSYRKSTIHQAEKKEKEPSKFKLHCRFHLYILTGIYHRSCIVLLQSVRRLCRRFSLSV